MKKSHALSQFGDPESPAAVAACAEALKISRQAIYMWGGPDDEIPELRALQIEKIVEGRAIDMPTIHDHDQAPPPA